ncbi:DUF5677 domain-containing protein [Aliivibrio fischeri]|uniref:DUF5677 domain-containing protein n=1 Tax=Aliivibrio fischeri TaxID=668 RepID=UPI001F1E91CB|nr:DUF5677 domain-containing protein [Aliivibrio fischeri]MCE7535603.1 DUF5677 domain-containing protein [Aliivibrio fischeri]MCE7559231.1 DUF5677 domain-containing protein [Aliivibrio fischeri]
MKDILKHTIEFSTEKAVLFQFESRCKLAAYSMGIYCSLIELSDTFHTLMKFENYTGSLSVYRSFIENFVDLRNLKLNPFYVNQLDYDSYLQDQRKFKAAKNDNLYIKFPNLDLDFKLNEINGIIKSLKENKEFKLCGSIKHKFALAGMDQEYDGIYPTLSAESHCSLDAIFERHFEFDDTNKKVNLIINNKNKYENYSFYLANISNYLITAGILVANILEMQQLDEFVAEKEKIIADLQVYI